MPAAAERVLADTHSLPQVEVLVVGHHGAAGSTAPELLQAVSPEIAVISVGADNSYGHPAQAVLDRLTEAGTAVYLSLIHISRAAPSEHPALHGLPRLLDENARPLRAARRHGSGLCGHCGG